MNLSVVVGQNVSKMTDEEGYKKLYNAIQHRAPVAEITSFIVDQRMVSDKKWPNPFRTVVSLSTILHA